jgi:histidine triad (HIT) family protein
MSSIFSQIINKTIPAYIVFEDEKVIAFLDIFPKQKGHVLVVPKVEASSIYDLEDVVMSHVFLVGKRIAIALLQIYNPKKVSFLTLGLEIDHAHLHIIPIDSEKDIYGTHLNLEKDDFLDIQSQLIHQLSKSK